MSTLPHLTTLLTILADYPEGLTPEQLLAAMKDRGGEISRPTLNRLLVQGRETEKLVASGLTTGRTYRLANEEEQSIQTTTPVATSQTAPTQDIVSAYGSQVWNTADVLRGVGIKQSDWSGHMMPFFALMLLESRVLRLRDAAMNELFDGGKSFDPNNRHHRSDLDDYYRANTPSTNSTRHVDLLMSGEGLAHIGRGGSSGIETRLRDYLAGFDNQTQRLLGFGAATQEKFLGIETTIKVLAGKGSEHLAEWIRQWGKVDLRGYESADITTLEEHIKRRWADISADTAGEHYTPFDLFGLVTDLAADHFARHPIAKDFLTVYDPTCGGGNMLFGVADRLRELSNQQGKHLTVKAFGQEINDTLYALAAVEARFRPHSDIRYGNTLTSDQFTGDTFDLIVANPPYGVDWKGVEKDIAKDATGRFPEGCRPPVSDGQHLFLQHVQAHLADEGLAFVFCSGSTLFSGDAGGGESNARLKYFKTDDCVMGVIQLPKDEFFNTGINTYLWVFKKSKPESLAGRAFFLDLSELATKLRKSLGSKRNELNADARAKAVNLVRAVEETADQLLASPRLANGRREQTLGLDVDGNVVDCAKTRATLRLLDTNEVCYTKLELELTRGQPAYRDKIDFKTANLLVLPAGLGAEQAREQVLANKGLQLFTDMELDDAIDSLARFEVETGLVMDVDDRIQELQADTKTAVGAIKALLADNPLLVNGLASITQAGQEKTKKSDTVWEELTFAWNVPGQTQERSLFQVKDSQWTELGRAALNVTVKTKVNKKSGEERLVLTLSFGPDTEKDTETTPYSQNAQQNANLQAEFLGRWVKDPYVKLNESVGCEVNFNRLFPKTAERKSVAQINAELAALDAQLEALKREGV